MRTGQRVSSETVLESFPWLSSSWTVWLEPLWSSQRSKYRKCVGQTVTLTLLQKVIKQNRRKLYGEGCCSWLKFPWLFWWKLLTAKYNRHNVQLIEIMLNDGCKLGRCVVFYKFASLDAPVTLGVGYWPLTMQTNVHSKASVEFLVDRAVLGQVLLQVYLLSCQYDSTNTSH